jgi:glycosyltransferase involved in cell wall biosynthesis
LVEHPAVSIVMPCLDEARYIEPCLRSVLAQDYPRDRLEVIVADGGSTDGTRAILARLAAEDPRVVVVDNPRRIQAAGMNEGIRRAGGDVIVRMDVHCEYASDYVRRCVEALERTGADNVGGAQRARGATRFQRALCAALDSPLGVGGARYRSGEHEGYVDTVFLGAFRRRVFERVGLYDPGAVTNEDAELNQRIVAAGGRVWLSRAIVVHYYPRDSFRALAKQYFRYGRGRARTVLKHRELLTVRPVLPAAAVLLGALLLVTAPLQPVTPFAFGLAAAVTGAEAARVARRGGLLQVLTTWAIFPVLYLAHGTGFAAGLLRYLRAPDWGAPERLAPAAARPAAGGAV